MRTLIIIVFVLIASIGTPLFTNAQACTTAGATCTFSGSTGTCVQGDEGLYCRTTSTAPPSTVRDSVAPRGTGTNITLINPLNTGECAPNGNCLMNFLNKILEFVIKIGTVVVVLMTVYVGYLFVVAQGNSTKIEEAKKALLWTIVGALILLGSQAIAIAIKATVQALSVGQ